MSVTNTVSTSLDASPASVGIDLGTTNCVVAYVGEGGTTQILRNEFDERLTPSVVLFQEDEVIVGHVARAAREQVPNDVAAWVKRDIGEMSYSRPVRGKSVPPEVLHAYILRHLRRSIVSHFGNGYKAVVTVPAYYDERRRKSTADSAELAELDLLDIINEPTAAALAFGERLGYLSDAGDPRECLNVLVYDLGGGTFDVTVLQLKPGDVRTLATDGDVQLGGCDWDRRLSRHIWKTYCHETGQVSEPDAATAFRLNRLAEDAKHTLSLRSEATIHIGIGNNPISLTISRTEFERMTTDLVHRTEFTTKQVLRESGLCWSDITRVLLVGGSTRMPMIREMIKATSGINPDDLIDPDEAIARGAAIYAEHLLTGNTSSGRRKRLRVINVNSHSLGIEGINQQTLRKQNAIIIPRNTELPVEIQREFITRKADQESVAIRVLEGESSIPEECTVIGSAALRNLPPGRPAGFPVSVFYKYDSNGRLSVRGEIKGAGEAAVIELERVGGLAADRLHRWKTKLRRNGGFSDIDYLLDGFTDDDASGEDVFAFSEWMCEPPDWMCNPSHEGASTPTPQRPTDTHPAPPLDVPLAALNKATTQKYQSTSTRLARRPRQQISPFANAVGHFIASVVGLAVGYYILCWIRPEANFLKLELPGIEQHSTAIGAESPAAD